MLTYDWIKNGGQVTGIYFYRGRYYNSTFQRFISEDPVGIRGGINLYAYAANSPVNLIDPLGLSPGSGGGFGGGGGGFGGGGGGGGGGCVPTASNPLCEQNQTPAPSQNGLLCVGNALGDKGVSIGLDIIGAIPGLGNAVSAGAAVAGTAYGLATWKKDPIAQGFTLAGAGIPLYDLLLGGTKTLPVLGNIVSGAAGLYDIYGAVEAYQNCMSTFN